MVEALQSAGRDFNYMSKRCDFAARMKISARCNTNIETPLDVE